MIFSVICRPNYITSRHEDNVVYIKTPAGEPIEYWIKSHPMYPTYDYPLNLNCYASFRTRFSYSTQYLKFEVMEGSISGDAYIAFGNDYGDTEKYEAHAVSFYSVLIISTYRHTSVSGVTKIVKVVSNKENRKRIMMHFNTGATAVGEGFLAKINVYE